MNRVISLLALTVLAIPVCGQDKEFVNSIGMKFVRIEAGSFVMGQGESPPTSRADWATRDWDESPVHKVVISNAFPMAIHEVTNAQFEQFDPEHKKLRGRDGVSKGDNDPVTFVTWKQANDFCVWLSKKENKSYRLPTEAEWEYACRAGSTNMYSVGDTLTSEQANVGLNADGKPQLTVAVGSYKPNAWGLYDMHGNVQEWCLDWYGPYESGEQKDPVGREDGYAKVARGWSFLLAETKDNIRYCRSSNRSGHLPEDANRATGFRVVLAELPATKPLPLILSAYQKDVKQQANSTSVVDPKTPMIVDYSKANANPTISKDSWGPIFSQHNHFAASCVCPNGDILMVWYTCVSERGREMAQACSRLRAGSTKWESASLFFDVPDVNDHAPVLFRDGQRIYHFCTQSLKGWDNASNIVRWSEDNGVTWSKPIIMLSRDDTNFLSQPCSCIRAKDGTLILACDGDVHKDEKLLLSKDDGKTWKVSGGDMRKSAGGKYVIHPAIIQRTDGSLLSYLRGPDPMPVLLSKDMGETWDVQDTPFPGITSGQKAAVLRLASGRLLLCSMDRTKKVVGGGAFAALSLDDGKTWAHVRKVDGTGGYMSVCQSEDGTIYLVGTNMGAAAFNETWLKGGEPFPPPGK
jgi:formylglycine-generating enzyme required for sulfatase activity